MGWQHILPPSEVHYITIVVMVSVGVRHGCVARGLTGFCCLCLFYSTFHVYLQALWLSLTCFQGWVVDCQLVPLSCSVWHWFEMIPAIHAVLYLDLWWRNIPLLVLYWARITFGDDVDCVVFPHQLSLPPLSLNFPIGWFRHHLHLESTVSHSISFGISRTSFNIWLIVLLLPILVISKGRPYT